MKNTIYLLFTFMILASLSSCKKDKTETPKNCTGQWQGTMSLSSESFGMSLTLVQNGSALTGSFISDDESVYGVLNGSSQVKSGKVDIYFSQTDESGTFSFHFTGTVNSTMDEMSGVYYVNGYELGGWSASKSSTKAAVNHNQSYLTNLRNTLSKKTE
ncbi:MAG TPA: hypothetical protein VIH57_11295 [Bacteroidales bacterium]